MLLVVMIAVVAAVYGFAAITQALDYRRRKPKPETQAATPPANARLRDDLVLALEGLGYRRTDARRAVDAAIGDADMPFDQALRAVLKAEGGRK